MKELKPEKINVYSVHLISKGVAPNQDDEEIRRRSHLGLFDTDIAPEEIQSTVENNLGYLGKVIGSRAYLGESPVFVDIQEKQVEKGVIFESVGECLQYLKQGLTYQDILDGFRLDTQSVIKGV